MSGAEGGCLPYRRDGWGQCELYTGDDSRYRPCEGAPIDRPSLPHSHVHTLASNIIVIIM